MYAITSNGWRAIGSTDSLLPGETSAYELPSSLLITVAEHAVRIRRDQALRSSDWTQASDSPLSESEIQQWAVYRQALRELPQQETFPECVWPIAPSLKEGAALEQEPILIT